VAMRNAGEAVERRGEIEVTHCLLQGIQVAFRNDAPDPLAV
jgi:hypothetical protein